MSRESKFTEEISSGERFAFGKNWQAFLGTLSEQQVKEAEMSLVRMLGVDDMGGKRFLDAGSGSGIFSLAARNLGAVVHSFDYDPSSVRCTSSLKNKFRPDDPSWTIEQASVLDETYLSQLGQFDIVYCWGVLHHTGDMWRGLDLVSTLVLPSGLLYIALYNDQGWISLAWKRIKKIYLKTPKLLKPLIHYPVGAAMWAPIILKDLFAGKPMSTYLNYSATRGMSPYHDLIDWVGGYPFEVASPGKIRDFFARRGFQTVRLHLLSRGAGNNEYVFMKSI